VEGVHEEVTTGLLIEQVKDMEVHGTPSGGRGGRPGHSMP
jgi:hypothetical protein